MNPEFRDIPPAKPIWQTGPRSALEYCFSEDASRESGDGRPIESRKMNIGQ